MTKTEENAQLRNFHTLEGLKWQYGTGDRQTHVSPDNWNIDLRHLERPENGQIQLDLFYDYQTNVKLYHNFRNFHLSP